MAFLVTQQGLLPLEYTQGVCKPGIMHNVKDAVKYTFTMNKRGNTSGSQYNYLVFKLKFESLLSSDVLSSCQVNYRS